MYEQAYQHAWMQRQQGTKPRQSGGLLIPAKTAP
jgi:hypothetical protein